MNPTLINQIVESLQPEFSDIDDFRNLSFYEGAFYVFSDQQANEKLDVKMFHSYLNSFLSEGMPIRETLQRVHPELLAELDEVLSELTIQAGG